MNYELKIIRRGEIGEVGEIGEAGEVGIYIVLR